jgi:hypothetical protein
MFWAHARTVLADAPLFQATWTRYLVSAWHRQTVGEGTKNRTAPWRFVGSSFRRPSVTLYIAGVTIGPSAPLAQVLRDRGHSSTAWARQPNVTLTKYARFQPSASDRDRWEQAAAAYDESRLAAK